VSSSERGWAGSRDWCPPPSAGMSGVLLHERGWAGGGDRRSPLSAGVSGILLHERWAAECGHGGRQRAGAVGGGVRQCVARVVLLSQVWAPGRVWLLDMAPYL
jgi:hypothetical protein